MGFTKNSGAFQNFRIKMEKVEIYGIKNCDTMKKAFDWLNSKGIAYTFHDYKTEGISSHKLEEWFKKMELWKVLNTKSSTWRETPDTEKATILGEKEAISFLTKNTSAIKRPVLEYKGGYLLGFNAAEWENALT